MTPYYSSKLATVYNMDCRDMLEWTKPTGVAGTFDAVITDPPFNIGQGYDAHDDKMTKAAFESFNWEWVYYCYAMLRPGGIFAINIPDAMVKDMLIMCETYMERIDWIIWHYRFGQCVDSKFISSHTHCLVFRKGQLQHTWNPAAVAVDSDRYTKYNDARTLETANPGKRVPFDVWSTENDGPHWSRLVGNNLEKVPNHPNQLPEKYIERLIRAYTNPGDVILEPFGGTGTVPVVAEALNRRCVCIELSQAYCEDIKNRLIKGAVRV